jgi:hypothetical protein
MDSESVGLQDLRNMSALGNSPNWLMRPLTISCSHLARVGGRPRLTDIEIDESKLADWRRPLLPDSYSEDVTRGYARRTANRIGATTMKSPIERVGGLVAITALCLVFAAFTRTAAKPPATTQKEGGVSMRVTGPFDVKLVPQDAPDKAEGSTLGRMSIDKHYHGDLEAIGTGQMLTALTDVKDSAGYVAIERITGTLNGKTGSFVVQHSGTLNHGAQQLSVTVVPDSGTGQLKGIAGNFNVIIAADGKHSYVFDYTLPESH